ncbi:pentapeptide repeat-containing protein [Kitasatospora purpeofusca]|uniref:pentapeptide repeat-containing protein n=1 Tax=Kitasatospora purpeofusca TaxID=67352 RepID=UPI003F4A86D5
MTTSTGAPPWPACGFGPAPVSTGCRGRSVDPHPACLEHLGGQERAAYLAALAPGTALDHRGTLITAGHLAELLAAVTDQGTDTPCPGLADFDDATFTGNAHFRNITFTRFAAFSGAAFTGGAYFRGGAFAGGADFKGVAFTGNADFGFVTFTGDANFRGAAFAGDANFRGATFTGNAVVEDVAVTGRADFGNVTFARFSAFGGSVFHSGARFRDSVFSSDAFFRGTVFSRDTDFGRAQIHQANGWDLVCDGVMRFDEAVFQRPTLLRVAARTVEFRRTHFVSTAHLRLKYATVDLTDAVLEAPTTVAPANTCFTIPRGTASTLLDPPPGAAPVHPAVKVASVSGVDAAHLVLADVDLTGCRFIGAVHLDQLRMDGHCTLAQPPTGLRRRHLLPMRHTRRSVITEERHWQRGRSADGGGWPPPAAPGLPGAGPAALAAVYRQLRKSLEDGKNEAEAADFYYGEMQMRRHNRARPGGERALLALYWAVSGYGQRASRAFGWLLATMAVTLVGMVLWGLPVDDPKPRSEGDVVAGHVTLVTDTPSPVNPTGSLAGRVTGRRTEKAGRVVVNSVIFRSSGQNLTTAGTYLEMASRLTEPVLLGFGLLAVRSRVKR